MTRWAGSRAMASLRKMKQFLKALTIKLNVSGEPSWGCVQRLLCTELEGIGELEHWVAGGDEEWTECWHRE